MIPFSLLYAGMSSSLFKSTMLLQEGEAWRDLALKNLKKKVILPLSFTQISNTVLLTPNL